MPPTIPSDTNSRPERSSRQVHFEQDRVWETVTVATSSDLDGRFKLKKQTPYGRQKRPAIRSPLASLQCQDVQNAQDAQDDQNGQDGQDGQDAQDGQDGQDGQDVHDGQDGQDGQDDTVQALREHIQWLEKKSYLQERVIASFCALHLSPN